MNRKLLHIITVPFIALLFGLAVAAGLGQAPQVRAASPIYVRTDGDDTICNGQYDAPATSAPNCAFATIGKGVAEVDSGGTVVVAAGVYTESVTINRDLTLQGAGAGSTIVDGGGTDRVVFVVGGYAASISGVTIRNGNADWGGGIRNRGTLTLTNSTVASNTGTSGGGGIYNSNAATLVISDCIVISNTSGGEGGGILNSHSTLTVVNSTIISNSADSKGGGMYNFAGTLTLDDSIVRGNHASGASAYGGGIFNYGDATLTNVAISGNTSDYYGGGIHNQDPMTLTNVTISGNTAEYGGGIFHTGSVTLTVVNCTIASNTTSAGTGAGGIQIYSPATFKNTLLAHNDNGNCSIGSGGTLTSNGHNLDSGTTCGLNATGDITSTNPLIGPLADNGGPSTGSGQATLTHALLVGSPAIDAGVCVAGVTTDQRGVIRPQGDGCDIGAYEFAPVAPASVSISGPTEGLVGESYAFTATVNPPTVTLPITYTWSPTPASGQGTDVATYTWITPGAKTITITVENVAGAAPPGTHDIAIAEYKVYLPLVLRERPVGQTRGSAPTNLPTYQPKEAFQ